MFNIHTTYVICGGHNYDAIGVCNLRNGEKPDYAIYFCNSPKRDIIFMENGRIVSNIPVDELAKFIPILSKIEDKCLIYLQKDHRMNLIWWEVRNAIQSFN